MKTLLTDFQSVIFAILSIKLQKPHQSSRPVLPLPVSRHDQTLATRVTDFYFRISPCYWVVHCFFGLWTESSRNERKSVLTDNNGTLSNFPLLIGEGIFFDLLNKGHIHTGLTNIPTSHIHCFSSTHCYCFTFCESYYYQVD